MVNLVVAEVVAGEHECRHEVGVAQPRSAAAARQEAENVTHHVAERRRRVGSPGKHGGAVGGQVKTGSVLGTWVTAVLPLGTPVLDKRQLQGLDGVAVGRWRPHDVLGAGGSAGAGEGTSRAAATDGGSTIGVRDQRWHEG